MLVWHKGDIIIISSRTNWFSSCYSWKIDNERETISNSCFLNELIVTKIARFIVSNILFQVFFCERSDYFKALIKNHFGENEISDNCNPMVRLCDVNTDIFTRIMYYIYQDSCEVIYLFYLHWIASCKHRFRKHLYVHLSIRCSLRVPILCNL